MKKLTILLVLTGAGFAASAQNFGLSFSYFIPKNGYASTPVSPFSIRGVGVNINRFLAIQTGASLYRMAGLAMKDLPIASKDPFVGPNFTLFVPAELVIQAVKGSNVQLDIKGGGFFFYGMGQRLNYGNIDQSIRTLENYAVANANFTYKNNPGFGYYGGAELTVKVTREVAVSLEWNYLVGQSKLPLTGSYTGAKSPTAGTTTTTLETTTINYSDAKIDFTGSEFSIGLIFSSGGGGGKQKRRR